MSEMNVVGRILIVCGIGIAIAGTLLIFAGRLPLLGRLPGDIYIQKRGCTFFFPITTSVIISIIATLVFALLRRR